jgi:hypothetical protein
VRAVVLVEGGSDRAAVETLAGRRGLDLAAEGVAVVSMGGATNIASSLAVYGPSGLGVSVSGLYDVAEEDFVRRALTRFGLDPEPSRSAFFACVADLEDELIRALGSDGVERVLDAEGELASFRRFQRQPAQRARTVEAQLHRFLGTRSGRKHRYGRLLVEALDLARVPRPLDRVLTAARSGAPGVRPRR